MKYVVLGKICEYAGLSDIYFPVYVLGFCPCTRKFDSEKILIFVYLLHCPTESTGKFSSLMYLQNSVHEAPNLLHWHLPVPFFLAATSDSVYFRLGNGTFIGHQYPFLETALGTRMENPKHFIPGADVLKWSASTINLLAYIIWYLF